MYKMLLFIDKNDEEELALICVFGPQEKEWWSVTYDTDGLLRQAWLHKKNPKSGDYGQTASYNRDRKGFYGGNMDGKFDFISEAKMLKILGMKSPYLREEIKLLEKIR